MEVLFQKYVDQNAMTGEEAEMMTGALTYKDKTATAVMTPKDRMFSLSINDKLDFRALSNIFKSGFSRIPVLGRDENHVVGMILTKDLILIDPEEEHTVKAAMQLFGRTVHQIFPDMKRLTLKWSVLNLQPVIPGSTIRLHPLGACSPIFYIKHA